MKKLFTAFCSLIFLSANLSAQTSSAQFWSEILESKIQLTGKRQIVPQKFRSIHLDAEAFKSSLFLAPNESKVGINQSTFIISLPAPDGSMQEFRVIESPILMEPLASQFPNIKTFSVKGISDPSASGKLDWNEFGFHGMVRSIHGDFFIDPYCLGNIHDYISYYTNDFIKDPSQRIPEGSPVINENDQKNKEQTKLAV